jgi:TolB-like protein
LLAFALGLVVAGRIHGEQPSPLAAPRAVQVALAPFDIWGNATVEIADAVSTSLTALLKNNVCFEVVSRTSPSVEFVVEGLIHAEPKRRIAALRITDPKTGQLVWSENYDYTNITGDMMARDVFRALQSGTRCAPE